MMLTGVWVTLPFVARSTICDGLVVETDWVSKVRLVGKTDIEGAANGGTIDRLNVSVVGSPGQEPLNPGLVHVIVVPPTAPVTVAAPVHRGAPAGFGREMVNVPVKVEVLTAPLVDVLMTPLIVPSQPAAPAHVPTTAVADCVTCTVTGVAPKFDD